MVNWRANSAKRVHTVIDTQGLDNPWEVTL